MSFLDFSSPVIKLECDTVVSTDARDANHENGGEDKDNIAAGESKQQSIDRTGHSWS